MFHGGAGMAVRSLAMASHFEELEDPRMERTRKHSLVDILCLSICAVIAGAEGWEDIEEFGLQKEAWLRRHLRLENGIPSHDTISRVFRLLKPQAFEAAFRAWVQVLVERLGLRQIAIDGKTLRRSHDRGGMKSALHVVCAWSVENHLVLGQEAVADKSNEITAIPELLQLLELKGAIVTIDAMGCQKEIAEQIAAAGGDFVLAVKDNQPKLHAALQQHFETRHAEGRRGRGQHHATREKGHGRKAERHYYQTPIPAELAWITEAWPAARSLGQVISYMHPRWPGHLRGPLLSQQLDSRCQTSGPRSPRPLGHRELAALGAGRFLRRGRTAGFARTTDRPTSPSSGASP